VNYEAYSNRSVDDEDLKPIWREVLFLSPHFHVFTQSGTLSLHGSRLYGGVVQEVEHLALLQCLGWQQ